MKNQTKNILIIFNDSVEEYELLYTNDILKDKPKVTAKITNQELNFSDINQSQDVNNFLGSECDYFDTANNKSKLNSTAHNNAKRKFKYNKNISKISPNRVFLPPSAPTLNFGIMKNIMKRKNTVVKKMTPNIPFDPSNLTNKDFASLKLGKIFTTSTEVVSKINKCIDWENFNLIKNSDLNSIPSESTMFSSPKRRTVREETIIEKAKNLISKIEGST